MSLFNVLIDIAARTASFESGIQRVEKGLGQLNATATRFARSTGNLIGVSLGFEAIRRSIGGAIERGDGLDRLSDRMKTTATFLSQMQFVAAESDVPFDRLAGAIDTLRKNVSLAAEGLGKARPALQALRIEAKDLVELPLERQLDVVADRIAAIENPTIQTRIAIQLFSDAGADMIPILKRGSEGIRELRAESDRLGQTLDSQGAKKLAEVDEAMKRMKASAAGLSNQLAVALAPAIISVSDSLRKLAGGATELEKLETKLGFLKEERNSVIPLILNFGYVDGGGVVMGPKALDSEIKRIEDRIAALKNTAGNDGSSSALSEVVVTSERRQETNVRHFINPQTLLEFERNVAYVEEIERGMVAESERQQQLFRDSIEDGVGRGIQETTDRVTVELERMVEATDDASGRMSVFWEEGMRNMQDHFADFLFDPFKDGLDGMLKGFIDVIRRMLAEAAAAKVFETLFGGKGKGGGGGGSSLMAGGNFDFWKIIGGMFGGFKADGGPLRSGKWYVAGEHGPEPIWGGGSGAYAMGYQGAGAGAPIAIEQHNHFHNMRDVTDEKMASYAARISDATIARLRDHKRRGQF